MKARRLARGESEAKAEEDQGVIVGRLSAKARASRYRKPEGEWEVTRDFTFSEWGAARGCARGGLFCVAVN